MTICNTANDGWYHLLLTICNLVKSDKKLKIDDLFRVLTCDGKLEKDLLQKTFKRWKDLSLFKEEKNLIKFSSEKLNNESNLDQFLLYLRHELRKIIFDEKNNRNFWDQENNITADFTRALAWMLYQDIYNFPKFSNTNGLQKFQFGQTNKVIIGNDVRKNGILSWAENLGFLSHSPIELIDPTIAIKETIQEYFDKKRYLVIEFMNKLSNFLPVLDFGNYRKLIEEGLNDNSQIKKPAEKQLSMAISLALIRLEELGILKFESISDDQNFLYLIGEDFKNKKQITHIIVGDLK